MESACGITTGVVVAVEVAVEVGVVVAAACGVMDAVPDVFVDGFTTVVPSPIVAVFAIAWPAVPLFTPPAIISCAVVLGTISPIVQIPVELA